MAERRMFTKKITDSDAFIELSSSTQALYFHLNQGADDDGFNNQVQNAMFKAHASIDDLKVLLMKNFIIKFESGVIVIKHWRMHNTLRKDRYTPTNFQEELQSLNIKDNGSYTINTIGCQVVAKRLPQYSKGKNSIDKNSIDIDKTTNDGQVEDICPPDIDIEKETSISDNTKTSDTKKFIKPTIEEIKKYCDERKNNIDAEYFYDFYESKDWFIGKNKMKNWKACIRTWEKDTSNKSKQEKKKRYF